MSCWSHVAAIFRIDDFRFGDSPLPDFEALFGKEIRYGSHSSVWEDAERSPEKYLPMGSEGSLRMSFWVNSDPQSLAAYTVSIFGDLRDHEDVGSLIKWFDEKCNTVRMIRQAVITVENDCYGVRTKAYGEDR